MRKRFHLMLGELKHWVLFLFFFIRITVLLHDHFHPTKRVIKNTRENSLLWGYRSQSEFITIMNKKSINAFAKIFYKYRNDLRREIGKK